MMTIDLNCDMGEGMESDAAIFPFISSANIACGGHAGDDDTMRRTMTLALEYGVAIGAHPSYPDRSGFGRTDVLPAMPTAEVLLRLEEELIGQLQRIARIAAEMGAVLRHVKPHGALYNRAARDEAVSDVICDAIRYVDPGLLLYGLSGGLTGVVAEVKGMRFVREVFADRTYQPDGSLTPRTQPGALIEDVSAASRQALNLVLEGRGETICLHGDGLHAVEFARVIREALEGEGIMVQSPGR